MTNKQTNKQVLYCALATSELVFSLWKQDSALTLSHKIIASKFKKVHEQRKWSNEQECGGSYKGAVFTHLSQSSAVCQTQLYILCFASSGFIIITRYIQIVDSTKAKGECERRAALFGPSVTTEEVINDYNTHPCQHWERGEKQPSYRELHHPNNIILFMWLVDRSPVWLAWGSAQVNWKPELCNSTGSWADIVPLVITQKACVSVYRLHFRFMAPAWDWNIRGQVMDVAINSAEGAEMGYLQQKTNLRWLKY